jgi:hypothetical protein
LQSKIESPFLAITKEEMQKPPGGNSPSPPPNLENFIYWEENLRSEKAYASAVR